MKTSEIQITYKNQIPLSERFQITSSHSADEYFKEIWDEDLELRESFYVLFLDQKNRVKGYTLISKGGISWTVVDIRIIFAIALKSLSTGILIGHNHPSSDTKPSTSDKNLTKKIKDAGDLVDINLLDHIIITPEGRYFSFADEGLL